MPDPPWLGRSTATHTRSDLIIHGLDILEQWIDHCHLRSAVCLALFDHNDVVNTLSREEAVVAGIELDHLSGANDNMPCLLCSYGRAHSHEVFLSTNAYLPFLEELDGYVFTDVRKFTGNEITVYREAQLPPDAIRITGDKGCVSHLFRGRHRIPTILFNDIPTILFDDKEDAIDAHRRGHSQNEGFVVKRGRKRSHHHRAQYDYAADPHRWVELVRLFGMRHGAITPASQPSGPYQVRPSPCDPMCGAGRPIPAYGSYWRHNVGSHPLYLRQPSLRDPVILHNGRAVRGRDVVFGPVHAYDETAAFVAAQVPWPPGYCASDDGAFSKGLVWVNLWNNGNKHNDRVGVSYLVAVPWTEVDTWRANGWRDRWLSQLDL